MTGKYWQGRPSKASTLNVNAQGTLPAKRVKKLSSRTSKCLYTLIFTVVGREGFRGFAWTPPGPRPPPPVFLISYENEII